MADQQLAAGEPCQPVRFLEEVLQPLARLRSELDRAIDELPARWPTLTVPPGLAAIMPSPAIRMTETDTSYKVTVEVPGIPPESLDIEAEQGQLSIKGEKKDEKDEAERDMTRSERTYGSFVRRIALPADARIDHIKAKAHDGILTISIPRDGDPAKARRKIEIKTAKKD